VATNIEKEQAALAARLRQADHELVALPVAAAITYYHVTDPGRQVETRELLAELLPLVAIALSTVAPIRRADGARLSERELDQVLCRAKAGAGVSTGELALLRMRRGELRDAMTLLKQARIAFGQPR
jgi:hypothetical protein